MNFQSQSALFCALLSLVFCLTVWFRKDRSRTTLPFFLFNLTLFAMSVFSMPGGRASAHFQYLAWSAGLFAAPCLVYLIYTFVYHEVRALEVLVVALFLAAAVASAGLLSGQMGFLRHWFDALSAVQSERIKLATVLVSGSAPIGILMVRTITEPTGLLRNRYITISIIGLICLLAAAGDKIFYFFGVPFPRLMFLILALLDYYLHQTVVRFRRLTLRVLAANGAVFILAAVFLAAIYGRLLLFKPTPSLFIVHTLAAGFILMILYEPVLTRVEAGVSRLLFRDRFGMRERLDALADRLGRGLGLEEVFAVLNKEGRVALGAAASVVYLTEGDGQFAAATPSGTDSPKEFRDPALEKLLRKRNDPLPLPELESSIVGSYHGPERESMATARRRIADLNLHVVVPLKVRETLTGFWGIRLVQPLDQEELPRLKRVADQVALRIENAKIYEKYRAADRLATVGEMAAGLAHEIRNPLGSVKGAAQYLRDEDLPESSREFVNIIVDEVNRLDAVLSRFLDLARPFEVNRSSADLSDIAARAARMIFSDKSIENIRLVQLPIIGKVVADVDQELIMQAIINLIKNAVEAHEGKPGEVDITAGYDGDWAWVEVADRGKGISPELAPKLFIPFNTTKEKGSGLGLAISQRIAVAHGGRIEARPREGGGAVFRLMTPAERH